MRVDERSDGQELEVSAGQEVEICLDENPTTGFRWYLEPSGAAPLVLGDDRFEATPDPLGGGGRHCWRFQAVRPGVGRIALSYRRPWSPEETPARTFSVRVRVGDMA